MGSLITALQNQNIAAANQETLGDIYAANPQNLGYTDNPFGYTAAPAVIQTAYPKYGYNATAPMTPTSYDDYDLTTLFSMLQSMQNTQPAQTTTTAPAQTTTTSTQTQAVTPAGILAAVANQVQQQQTAQGQQQTGQTTPVQGAYTVPSTKTVKSETKKEDAQAASDERIRKLIAENAAKKQRSELEQRYKKTTGLVVNPNASNWELRQVLDDPSSPFNVTE
jgi:hypothetical protein